MLFRTNAVVRSVIFVVDLVMGVTAVSLLVFLDRPLLDRAVVFGVLFLSILAANRFVFTPRLEIGCDNIRIVAPLGEVSFPTTELESAEGGRFLVLNRRGYPPIKAYAVSNANLTVLLGRRGRTQRVADEINDFLRAKA